MSIIGSMEATPSRVRLLVSVLSERTSGETPERLLAFCSPKPLWRNVAEPTVIFRQTLKAAKDLRLIEEDGDKLRLTSHLSSRREFTEATFLASLEAVLLPVSAPDDDGEAAFARAIAWFLMQSVKLPLQFGVTKKDDIQKQLGDEGDVYDLTNKDRWNAFTYWCRYLGFGEALAARSMVPDPTVALRRLLPRVFSKGQEAPIGTFLQSLASVSPVFEEGRVRSEVEGRCRPAFARQPQRLSQSTSFALIRLEQLGLIHLDARADAQAMVMDFGADAPRRLSRVIYKGERA